MIIHELWLFELGFFGLWRISHFYDKLCTVNQLMCIILFDVGTYVKSILPTWHNYFNNSETKILEKYLKELFDIKIIVVSNTWPELYKWK